MELRDDAPGLAGTCEDATGSAEAAMTETPAGRRGRRRPGGRIVRVAAAPEMPPAEAGGAASPAAVPSPAPEEIPADVPAVLEALLFASAEPLPLRTLAAAFEGRLDAAALETALRELGARLDRDARGIRLAEVARGWRLETRPELASYLRRLVACADEKLTPAAIETLAIIAYKQPVTRADVDAIRGVGSGPIIRSLMDRRLVRVTGRAELPGAPFQYGTTSRFLLQFGLRTPSDLPRPRDL